MRILVVDDELTLRFLAQRQLGSLGYHCELAEDGLIAVEKATKDNFDLILMDVQMPNMNGLEATKAIRDYELATFKSFTPIVAMTAYSEKAICLNAGMNDYLIKPVMLDQMNKMLSQWLVPSSA